MKAVWVLFIVFVVLMGLLISPAHAQWTEPVRISDSLGMLPFAAVIGDSIHVVFERSQKFGYVNSSDNGITWGDVTFPASIFNGNNYHPFIMESAGKLHVVWRSFPIGNPRQQIFHFSSSDGGNSWSDRHQVFNNNSAMLKYPRLAAVGDTLFFSCRTVSMLLSFRSLDGGVTWGDSAVVESGPIVIDHDQIMLYAQGRVHLVYQLALVGDSVGIEIYHSYSDDYGLTWSERYPLSTLEPIPNVKHGQAPSAYIDSAGNIIAAWYDYKYGSACGFTGDILARISTDNGDSWLPESRLTFTQTGSGSSVLIVNDTLYSVWSDDIINGCFSDRLMYSFSTDWGVSWANPTTMSDFYDLSELDPYLFYTSDGSNTFLHCVFRRELQPGADIFYSRNAIVTEIIDLDKSQLPENIQITAYPNPFNSRTIMAYRNLKGGEIEIYNITGQKVKTLTTNNKEGQIEWDARDALGNKVSTGIYFARARAPQEYITIKLLNLR